MAKRFKAVRIEMLGVLLVWSLVGHGEVSSATSTPEGVVNQFLELEWAGERSKAWELLVPEDQQAISQADFSALYAKYADTLNLELRAIMRPRTSWETTLVECADDAALIHLVITHPAIEEIVYGEDFTSDLSRVMNAGIDIEAAIIELIRQRASHPGGLPTHTETREYRVRRVEGQWRIDDGWATGVEVNLQLRRAAEVE